MEVIRLATASVSCGAISCMSASRFAIVTDSSWPSGRSATRVGLSVKHCPADGESRCAYVKTPYDSPSAKSITRLVASFGELVEGLAPPRTSTVPSSHPARASPRTLCAISFTNATSSVSRWACSPSEPLDVRATPGLSLGRQGRSRDLRFAHMDALPQRDQKVGQRDRRSRAVRGHHTLSEAAPIANSGPRAWKEPPSRLREELGVRITEVGSDLDLHGVRRYDLDDGGSGSSWWPT